MAFHDRPQVDRYSKNANRSELAVAGMFCEEHGFICRQPVPDKGCDFQLELIREDGGATNHYIFVQLKSIEQLNTVAGGQIISYNFETSRLAYLQDGLSSMVLLFDIASGHLYYEHVQIIIEQLDASKNSREWRDQDSVQIHIPLANLIDRPSVQALHRYFSKLFDKISFLHQSQGPFYGIPVAGELPPDQLDLRNPDLVKEFMLQYRGAMMNTYALGLAVKLLASLPSSYLEAEIDLLLIAAVVYSEVGRHHDSENYIRKLKTREAVSENYQHLIPFVHLKNQLALDHLSMTDFISKVSELRDQVMNTQNKIVLELSIILYEQSVVQFMHRMPDDMYVRIQSLSARIKNDIPDENGRLLLLINNIENLAGLINYHRIHQLNELALLELFNLKRGSPELEALSDNIARWSGQLYRELGEFYEEAVKRGDKLLQASVILVRSRFVVAGEIDLVSQYPMLQHLCFENQEVIAQNISYAVAGADLFENLNYFSHAYQSLRCAIELVLVSRGHYRYADQTDLEQLMARKAQMEQQWDLIPYPLLYPQIAEKRQEAEDSYGKKPIADVKHMDDTQLSGMANVIARSMRLNKQQRGNLLFELRTYRTFYRRCGEDYKIRRIPSLVPPRQAYVKPSLFVIEHKVTGVSSTPTRNIDTLLDRWGL